MSSLNVRPGRVSFALSAHHLLKTEQWEAALAWLEDAAEAGQVGLLQPRHAKVCLPARTHALCGTHCAPAEV